MEPTPELAAQLDQDRFEAAKMMTFEERALGGVVMFDILIDAMRGILRVQYPDASEQMIEHLILQRLRSSDEFEAAA